MSDKNSGSAAASLGFIILFVIVFGGLRGCIDEGFQYRNSACTRGTSHFSYLFKSLFVCLWV
jgi:hypothetical protein